MAVPRLDPDEGLVDLTQMSLSQLAELDDDFVSRAVGRLAGAAARPIACGRTPTIHPMPHNLDDDDLTALASGRVPAPLVHRLAEAQRSKQKLLLEAVRRGGASAGSFRLLSEVEREHVFLPVLRSSFPVLAFCPKAASHRSSGSPSAPMAWGWPSPSTPSTPPSPSSAPGPPPTRPASTTFWTGPGGSSSTSIGPPPPRSPPASPPWSPWRASRREPARAGRGAPSPWRSPTTTSAWPRPWSTRPSTCS